MRYDRPIDIDGSLEQGDRVVGKDKIEWNAHYVCLRARLLDHARTQVWN